MKATNWHGAGHRHGLRNRWRLVIVAFSLVFVAASCGRESPNSAAEPGSGHGPERPTDRPEPSPLREVRRRDLSREMRPTVAVPLNQSEESRAQSFVHGRAGEGAPAATEERVGRSIGGQ